MKTTLEILTQARELISDPKRWTKEAPARDADRNPVSERAPSAVCWCSLGAIFRSGGESKDVLPLRDVLGQCSVMIFNDNPKTTHADVLAAFSRAIASL